MMKKFRKARKMVVFAAMAALLTALVTLSGCGEANIDGDSPVSSNVPTSGVTAKAQTGTTAGTQMNNLEETREARFLNGSFLPKIDISKCESPESVPFTAYDSTGKKLQAEVFPEWWGGAIYCTISPREAWAKKFENGGSADKVAEGSTIRFDFGQYLPSEVTVSRDSGVDPEGVPELTAVKCRSNEDGIYEFEAKLYEQGPTYYIISAKWDESHNIDYALALDNA